MYRAKTTLEQWRILQAVVDYGGYAQAATMLNKSQSSLNHAVSKLQHQLGVQLLEIRGRKAFLTDAGEVMLRRSRKLSQTIEELEELADSLELGWEPEILLSLEMVYPRDHLLRVLSAFLPLSRGTRLNIIDSVLTGNRELIQAHKVDIAITSIVPKGYLGQPLCTIKMLPLCHPQHPLLNNSILDSEQLEHELQVVIRDTASKPDEARGWLRSEQRWTVNHFHEAINILKRGMGFAWIPEYLAMPLIEHNELAVVPLSGGSFIKEVLRLVLPSPDYAGPGTRLLETLFLKEHSLIAYDGEEQNDH